MTEQDIKISPDNILRWSHMEDWENGASSAPTEHTLSGSGASVAREASTVKVGSYSAALTRSGADCEIYTEVDDYLDYINRVVTLSVWVYATVASRGRIQISDGVGTSNSSYHTGGGTWERIEVKHIMDGSSTRLRVSMQVNSGDTTVYFDGGCLFLGNQSFTTIGDYTDIPTWKQTKRHRGQSFDIANKDGVKMPSVFAKGRNIKITGLVVGSTATVARNNYDTLLKSLYSYQRKLDGSRDFKNIYMLNDRYFKGHLNGSFDDEVKQKTTYLALKLGFDLPDPYSLAVNWTRDTHTLSSSPLSFTITPNSTAEVFPVFKITAGGSSLTSITVQNLTTNQSWSYTGTVTTGNVLEVDTLNSIVKNNGSQDLPNFTGEINMTLIPGDNEFKVTSTATGATMITDWQDRFQ